MKKAGQIYSGICIAIIITLHLIMAFKPFEWQRQPKVEPQQVIEIFRQEQQRNSPFKNDLFKKPFPSFQEGQR